MKTLQIKVKEEIRIQDKVVKPYLALPTDFFKKSILTSVDFCRGVLTSGFPSFARPPNNNLIKVKSKITQYKVAKTYAVFFKANEIIGVKIY